MSANCGNPDCPHHGDSPRAKATRSTRQAVVTNEELMTLIRVIASNVEVQLEAKLQQNLGVRTPNFLSRQFEVILGQRDREMVVQGVIDGFCAILMDHAPMSRLVSDCANIEPKDSYLEKVRVKSLREANEDLQKAFPGAPEIKFDSLEEILQHMKKMGQ